MTGGSPRAPAFRPSGGSGRDSETAPVPRGDRNARKGVDVRNQGNSLPDREANEGGMITIFCLTHRFKLPARPAACAALVLALATASAANAQQSFKTPEEAADALVSAARAG